MRLGVRRVTFVKVDYFHVQVRVLHGRVFWTYILIEHSRKNAVDASRFTKWNWARRMKNLQRVWWNQVVSDENSCGQDREHFLVCDRFSCSTNVRLPRKSDVMSCKWSHWFTLVLSWVITWNHWHYGTLKFYFEESYVQIKFVNSNEFKNCSFPNVFVTLWAQVFTRIWGSSQLTSNKLFPGLDTLNLE